MTITPIGNRLVVKLVKQKNTSASGIILTTEEKNEQSIGEIISLGKGVTLDGEINISELDLNIGQKIMFGKYSGEEIKDESDPETVFKILNAKDVLAIIEN
jgi:chaperonin GroES